MTASQKSSVTSGNDGIRTNKKVRRFGIARFPKLPRFTKSFDKRSSQHLVTNGDVKKDTQPELEELQKKAPQEIKSLPQTLMFTNPVVKDGRATINGTCTSKSCDKGIFSAPKMSEFLQDEDNDQNRLLVLMDVDLTMVKANFFKSQKEANTFAESLPKDENGRPVDHVVSQCRNSESFCVINLRPGLRQFIQEVSAIADLHMFTAGAQVYVESIAKLLDPNYWHFSPDKLWSNGNSKCPNCVRFDRFGNHFKHLSALPLGRKDLSRVVLIDDNDAHLLSNRGNVYCIGEFHDQPDDCELSSVMRFLKQELKEGDVRPILEEKFRSKATRMERAIWLQQFL